MKRPTFLKYSKKRLNYRSIFTKEEMFLLTLFLKDISEKCKIISEMRKPNCSLINIIDDSFYKKEVASECNKITKDSISSDIILEHEKMCQSFS